MENALLHGLRKRRDMEGACLSISASVREEKLIVTVEDNGPGLNADGASTGYGLRNVRQRLELFTAGQYELTICNRPQGGAIARIILPARHT